MTRAPQRHEYADGEVSQHTARVEHFSRQADGTWVLRALGPDDDLVIASVGCRVPVGRLYARVRFA